MKKPLMLISNDQHMGTNNIDTVLELLYFQIDKAVELGLDRVFFLGDLIDSRKSNKLDTLVAVSKILDRAKEKEVTVVCIPGNHDKSDYSSVYSWVYLFKDHDNFDVISNIKVLDICGISVTMLPFFSDEIMAELIDKANPSSIFLGHLEMNGSTNNGIKAEGRPIKPSMFSKFKLVLLGHYHTPHTIGKHIHHLPSLYQRNFSETETKGYTLVYDDLSIEHIQSKFKPFKTVKVDLDTLTPDTMNSLIKQANSGVSLRAEIRGSESKLKSFNCDNLIQHGIEPKIVHEKIVEQRLTSKELELPLATKRGTVEQYKSKISDVFKEFCEKENIQFEKGVKFLENNIK